MSECQTGKRKYKSPSSARKGNSANSKRIRVYVCPHCRSWHVTSQPKKEH